MDLEEALCSFGGRNVAPLKALAGRLRGKGAPWGDLATLARRKDPVLQVGATWLIKALLEQGASPGPRFPSRVVALMGRVEAPDAKLHLAQCLPFLKILPSREEELHGILLSYLEDDYKFLRAWAYNGLGLLAEQNPSYRAAVRRRFAKALESEPASVKARVRRASKALERRL